jgi:endoglucanase
MGMRGVGIALIAASLMILMFVIYRNSNIGNKPLIFSPTQVLGATWHTYKLNFISSSTPRTIDPSRDNQTTSEGQSYTMLRAVWMGDKETFDATWEFTKKNLQHTTDALFAWLYGTRDDGTMGVLVAQNGGTAASDADSDIALALLFAYARWQDPQYLAESKRIISSIWQKEVVVIDGVPYLAADNKEKALEKEAILINPSYFAPYAYRLFAKVDPAHPWQELVDSSYALLKESITAPLGGDAAGSLPPNWVLLNTAGHLQAPTSVGQDTHYGYDAMRIPWRIALDWQWNHDPRAKEVLSLLSPLGNAWQKNKALDTVYSHTGVPVGTYESPAMYGGSIGYFLVTDPQEAEALYTTKLAYLYDPNINGWKQPLSYYDDNWAWFGIALYNDLLPNLAAELPPNAFTTHL